MLITDFSSAANGVPAGWELKEKSGKADFAVVKDGDIAAARFRSANTSFSLQKEVKVDLKQFPIRRMEMEGDQIARSGRLQEVQNR